MSDTDENERKCPECGYTPCSDEAEYWQTQAIGLGIVLQRTRKALEAVQVGCGCPPRICIACGLSEPCGLHCPGADGQPDPNAPLVCEFDKTYKELCEENRRLRQAVGAARNAQNSAQGSVASTAGIAGEGEAS